MQVENILDNPQNEIYFAENTEEEYKLLKQSIETNGIRDPLKLRKMGDKFMLLAGRTRLKVAKELGMAHVPAVIYENIEDEEAEYILVADNDERRHNDDPIKKAKRDKIIYNYFKKKNLVGQTAKMDIKEMVSAAGYSSKTEFYRSVKLNDLIPDLQKMVSDARLSPTVADSLARMDQEDQKEIFRQLGDALEDIKVKEAKELKQELANYRKATEEARERAARLQNEVERLRKENINGHNQMKKLVEEIAALQDKLKKINVVDVTKLDPGDPRVEEYNNLAQKIEVNKKVLEELEQEKTEREKQIKEASFDLSDLQHSMQKIKDKTAREDKAIMMIRRKLGSPLKTAFGEIKFYLNDVDDDPYGNLTSCIERHVTLLQETVDLLESKKKTLKEAKRSINKIASSKITELHTRTKRD
jgi:ParB family chromosome partitioning protein